MAFKDGLYPDKSIELHNFESAASDIIGKKINDVYNSKDGSINFIFEDRSMYTLTYDTVGNLQWISNHGKKEEYDDK